MTAKDLTTLNGLSENQFILSGRNARRKKARKLKKELGGNLSKSMLNTIAQYDSTGMIEIKK